MNSLISLKTLYLFTASQPLQSFRFLNTKQSIPLPIQCSDTKALCQVIKSWTVVVYNNRSPVDINRVSTNLQPSQGPSEFTESARVNHSFQSRNPEHQDNKSWDREFWEPTQDRLTSCQNPSSPSFSELRNSTIHQLSYFGNLFPESGLTTPTRSRKRTTIRSSSFWGSKGWPVFSRTKSDNNQFKISKLG